MAIKNGPVQDVCPIETREMCIAYVCLLECGTPKNLHFEPKNHPIRTFSKHPIDTDSFDHGNHKDMPKEKLGL